VFYTGKSKVSGLKFELIDQTAAKRLCLTAASHALSIRSCFPFRSNEATALNNLVGLQHTLLSLMNRASDAPQEAFDALSESDPPLIRDVINALEVTARRRSVNTAAIACSCAAINELLLRVQYFRQGMLLMTRSSPTPHSSAIL
jgi:hypothetical protein